jgi:hypothetical protein
VTGTCVHGVVSDGGATSVALDLDADACSVRVMP